MPSLRHIPVFQRRTDLEHCDERSDDASLAAPPASQLVIDPSERFALSSGS
jgi:hypothetical protein